SVRSSNISERWRHFSQRSSPSTPWICRAMVAPIDRSAQYDEPYLRKGVVGILEALDLRNVTIVGEFHRRRACAAAADVPDRIRAVYALNTYDYETRYGDGIRRGSWFANLI